MEQEIKMETLVILTWGGSLRFILPYGDEGDLFSHSVRHTGSAAVLRRESFVDSGAT